MTVRAIVIFPALHAAERERARVKCAAHSLRNVPDPFLVGQHQELPGPAGDVGRSSGRNHGPRRQGGQLEGYTGPVLCAVQVQTETETAAENRRRTQVEDTHGHDEAAIEVVIVVRVPDGTGDSDRSRNDQ